MRRLAFLSLPLLAFVLAGGGTPGLDADTPSPSPSPSPSAEPSPSPLPSPTPVLEEKGPPVQKDDLLGSPAPSPSPNPDYHGSLKPGDWVQVTGTGDCLNVRLFPGSPPPPPPDAALPPDFQTPDNVINCLPDGFVGRLRQGDQQQMPVSADGHWWWNIAGVGWVAEDWLAFHHEGGLPWPQRPELAGAGLIAFMRNDGAIWLMNADGSGQRQLVPGGPDKGGLMYLEWAPTGDRLSVTRQAWTEGGGVTSTQVYDLAGILVAGY